MRRSSEYRALPIWAAAALLALSTAGASAQQTITVTTLHDVFDFAAPRQVQNLPGPDGRVSFQEACTAANNTAGPQTIEFAIPQSEFWLLNDMAVIELDSGPFVLTDDATTIDFSSQTRNIGDTNPSGPEVGIYGLQPNGWGSPAIIVEASSCVLHGLGAVWQRGSSIAIWRGDNNRITGCMTGTIEISGTFGGPPVRGNIVGGTTAAEANDLYSVEILCWSDENIVIGNRIRHVRVEGSQYCVAPAGNRIGGPTPEERNVIAGYGYYGEEGFPTGSMVSVAWAERTLVEGNFIGTTPDGMAREPQIGTAGVEVRDATNTTIRGNLIAGLRTMGANHYAGVLFGQAIMVGAINRDTQTTIIEDNLIGVAIDGVTPIPTLQGIVVAPSTSLRQIRDTRIGGIGPQQGNEIARVERRGVSVHSLITGVTIRGNAIHDNGDLGIDLLPSSGGAGVTLNDVGDADGGANGQQNFPDLTGATATAAAIQIVGALNSRPSALFDLDFYISTAPDPSGYGEAQRYIGSQQVQTDAAGNAAFDLDLAAVVAAGSWLTATATDAAGNTSEFSAAIEVALGPTLQRGDANCDGSIDFFDIDPFVMAIFDPVAYGGVYCDGDMGAADCNADGDVNFFDIDPFLGILFPG